MSPLALLSTKHGHTGKSPAEGRRDNQGTGASLLLGEAGRAESGQSGEEDSQGDLIHVHKCLKGGCKEDGARVLFFFFSFLVEPCARTKGHGQNLEH